MDDEGVHEIQLHGKQLVFVVMTATVVAVAVFLCGVMVGRGVPAARSDAALQSADAAAIEPAPTLSPLPEDDAPGSDATHTLEPRYGEILDPPDPVREEVLDRPRESREPKPRADTATARPSGAARAAAQAAPGRAILAAPAAPVAPVRAASAAPEIVSGRGGFVVQVSALKGRSEADTIRRRLEGKGYPAFIEATGAGRDAIFRVRVGRYANRKAAESVAARLEREERFKTWITR
jgi:cell division septation protein DedD